jgi:hypothetical protein
MSDIDVPGAVPDEDLQSTGRRLIPMKVGDATLYIEPMDQPAVIEDLDDDELRPVGVDPRQAFETASEALRECVKVVGDRLGSIGSAVTPDKIGMEFTLTFDVEGKATIIPVLLTGKAKSAIGIKVSAEWHPGATPTAPQPQAGQ